MPDNAHPDRGPLPNSTRTRAVGTSGIRRNLFNGSVVRRSTSSSNESTGSAVLGNDENARLVSAMSGGAAPNTTRYSNPNASSSGNIAVVVSGGQFGNVLDTVQPSQLVVRDKNGEVHISDTSVDDEADLALQERADKEKDRLRLREAVKHHQMTRSIGTAQPDDELLSEVKASLRNRVAALEDDEWMFASSDNIHK
ncbi:hypothetical protein BROUX41_005658 [Berkeleyomyces rouxiae]|uniref:uncharacterized protein n=1 Tax=Berkeleyomyces rouxiae TaxID=2035830 RepID=UPI003B79C047